MPQPEVPPLPAIVPPGQYDFWPDAGRLDTGKLRPVAVTPSVVAPSQPLERHQFVRLGVEEGAPAVADGVDDDKASCPAVQADRPLPRHGSRPAGVPSSSGACGR